jgi:hypothetical protein
LLVRNVSEDSLPFVQKVELQKIEFTPAWEAYQFGKDEGLRYGGRNDFSDNNLSFEFTVWKNEGGIEHPVEKITGTYKLEEKTNGGLRIVVDQLNRQQVADSDSS